MIIRIVIFMIFWVYCENMYAQNLKHDRNWVFGLNAGIDFNDINNPQPFYKKAYNRENTGTFSDSLGNLLFYTNWIPQPNNITEIHNSSGNIIVGGELINTISTCTNCFLTIPTPGKKNTLITFHIGTNYTPNCISITCYNLYYSIIQFDDDSIWVEQSNINLLNERIGERIAATKHANGKDWWILVRGTPVLPGDPCTNRYYKYLLNEDGLNGPFTQDIGSLSCQNTIYAWGEMNFSRDGKRLAIAMDIDGYVDVFDFNRCTGELGNFRLVDYFPNKFPYSCEFSPSGDVLYVSVHPGPDYISALYQYDLSSETIFDTRIMLWSDTFQGSWTGQLQIAPDNRIYYPIWYTSNLYQHKAHYLSVINEPDSIGLACDFEPFSFFLGDSSTVHFGLPNFPNYNLEAISYIFHASAGKDTIICHAGGDHIQIHLGVPSVSGLSYLWQPGEFLDDEYAAQPVATIKESQWFYVFITDTTGSDYCGSFLDSVYIEIRDHSYIYEAKAGENKDVCENLKGETIVELGTPAITDVNYDWSPKQFLDNPNTAQPLATIEESQWFYLTVTDNKNNFSCGNYTDSVYVKIKDIDFLYNASAGDDQMICLDKGETSVMLGVPEIPDVMYEWSPKNNLDNPNIAQPVASPYTSQWYQLTAKDNKDSVSCREYSTNVFIEVNSNCNVTQPEDSIPTDTVKPIFFPSLIVINNEGIQLYEIIHLPANSHLEIFNILGQSVFSEINYTNNWQLDNVASGLYFYRLTTQQNDVYKGKLIIAR